MENAFGYEMYTPEEAVASQDVRDLAIDMLSFIADLAGGDPDQARAFVDDLHAGRLTSADEPKAIRRARLVMGGDDGQKRIAKVHCDDICSVFEQLVSASEWPLQGQVLDLGCGSGDVGCRLTGGKNLTLADTVDYRSDASMAHAFFKIHPREPLPFSDNQFDSVLLISTLHHCEDPLLVLREAIRVCGGRLYIRESVVDVEEGVRDFTGGNDKSWETMAGFERRFERMSADDQRRHASIQDWFYNRLLQGGVPVPLNLAPAARWAGIFAEAGLEVYREYRLGFDERVSPEFHWLTVCAAP